MPGASEEGGSLFGSVERDSVVHDEGERHGGKGARW